MKTVYLSRYKMSINPTRYNAYIIPYKVFFPTIAEFQYQS